jgi:opacity protein-like surface antigen
MKRTVMTLGLFLFCAAMAVAQRVEFSVGYLRQQTDVLTGASVGLNGGRGDMAVSVCRRLDVVGEVAGVTTNNLAGSPFGLTLLSYSVGLRGRLPLKVSGAEHHPIILFGQSLYGGVHATNGAFPAGSALRNTANAFALSAGGGVDFGVNKRFAVRLVQIDYQYTHLPNLTTNDQNHFRIGAGVVLRLH